MHYYLSNKFDINLKDSCVISIKYLVDILLQMIKSLKYNENHPRMDPNPKKDSAF